MKIIRVLSLVLVTGVLACMASQTYSQNLTTPALPGKVSPEVLKNYPIEDGHLRIKPFHQLFFNMLLDEVRTDTIFLFNAWDSSMQIAFGKLPGFLAITAMPDKIPPFSAAYLLVKYDAAARNDFDMVVDKVDMLTNDTTNPVKSLELVAVITEDFSHYLQRDFRNAPVARLSAASWDFGTVQQGSIARYKLQITNEGKDTLHIRKIRSSCGCTTGDPDRRVLGPMESATIQVSFNTFGREGYHSKSVTIITNDPLQTHLSFTIGGTITK